MLLKVGIFFIFLVQIFSSAAEADVKLTEIKSDQTEKIIMESKDPKLEGFFNLDENYKIYGVKLLIDKTSQSAWKVESASDGIDLVKFGNETYILVGANEGQIKIINSQTKAQKEFKINWLPLKKGTITNECGTKAPKLITKDQSQLLVAVSCKLVDQRLFMTISTLANVEWESSTLFEQAGKGERWKYYQIPAWTLNGGSIAEFRLRKDGKDLVYNLVAPKDSETAQTEKITSTKNNIEATFTNEVSIGMMSLGFEASTVTATDSKLSLGYRFLSPKYWNHIKFGGAFITSLDIAKKDESLSYIEALLHAGYIYNINQVFDIYFAGAYQNANFQQRSTAAQMQNSQIGVLVDARYILTENNILDLEIYKTTFNSKVVTNNLSLEFKYKHKFSWLLNGSWVGAFYKTQKFDGVNESDQSRKYNENVMGVFFGF